ncbi:MAG: type IV secretory system conjugative DNA transfer family protein, partial [Planctomycetaceae bacterium]|nr:type IV secretory system conjugative DNA transfer family protein [Planctomycetaceae bacterium]
STVMQLGDRAFGSVNAELGNYVRWITDPQMRRHLSGPSDFSYREFGDDRHPITAFLVPPRIAMQEALPFLRVHAELSLQLFATRTNRPAIPTLFLCDEFRQYGERIRAIRDGATILRDARVKLWLFAQSWPSLVDTIGEAGANEFASCSAMQYYGIDDIETAERISRELGKSTKRVGGRLSGKPISEQVYDVVTPAEVMTELRKNAPLQYVFPTTSAPMRLSRVAHKPIVTEEGGRFQSLPLAGHFDDGLSRFTIGNRGA